MLCASIPCFIQYFQCFVLPSPAFFFLTSSCPLFLFLPDFLLQIILYGNYPPLTHCALASLPHYVCVCVFCVCVRWLMAGHWPLPLLGKLCLCPWGLKICATPEPQLQLWAQAGAKSFHLLLTFTSSTTSDQLSGAISHLHSHGLYLFVCL